MSHNPYQRKNRGQQPQAPSRPISNPYSSRNNSNRSANASNNNESGRSALSLATGPMNNMAPPQQASRQAPPETTFNTAATTANPIHHNIHSTTHSSNPYSDIHNNHDTTISYHDEDRIGNNAQNDFDNDLNAMNMDNVNTSNQHPTHANDTNDTTNNEANLQIQQLQQQLQNLRQELQEQSESNFDLHATIAAMQAEMDHSLQASQQQHKEEASKLQHLLRLEQQKSRQLELQHQQRMQQQENNEPIRKRPPSQSVFTKRLEAQAGMTAPLAIPQNITLPTTTTTTTASLPAEAPQTPPRASQNNNDPPPPTNHNIAKQPKSPPPPSTTTIPTTYNTTAIVETKTSVSRLAQHILQSIMDSKRSKNDIIINRKEKAQTTTKQAESVAPQASKKKGNDTNDLTNNEQDVEMVDDSVKAPPKEQEEGEHAKAKLVLLEIASENGGPWSEVQLVEFVLRQEKAWELWYPALFHSRLGRQQLLQAIGKRHEELEQEQQQQEGGMADNEATTTVEKPKSSRITRLGKAGGKAQLDATLETEIWNSLLDPLWDPNSMASVQESVHARLHQDSLQAEEEEVDPTTVMSPSFAYAWIQKLVESVNHQETQLPALRLLHTVLEECNDSHDDHALWQVCHEPMEQLLEGLYRQWMMEMGKLIKEEIAHGQNSSNSFLFDTNSRANKKKDVPKRRIEAAPVEELAIEPRDLDDIERCLALSLSIWHALISATATERLDLWYVEQKGARMVSIVLDILEEHEDLYDKRNRPRHPSLYSIKGWYLDAIDFLSTVGTSKSGMIVLRTRTRPPNVASPENYWMGNTLDVATRQLFSLVMDQEQDTRPRSFDKEFQMRTLAIEGWIRLWHQVLLYVQDQQLPDKQPVALSFRSLVLDHQNWYTSACAMLLADPEGTRRDIQTMIRLQLEELSIDEEEYEELRGR